jgi:hypothetical protein
MSADYKMEIAKLECTHQALALRKAQALPYGLCRCPTCQHFQPDYEKVASYFNTEPRVKPEVTVARVDCATEVMPQHPSSKSQNLVRGR